MPLRKSTILIYLTTLNALIFILLATQAQQWRNRAIHARTANRELVRKLRITDLCLFTEARYTRHPSMADRHAPFQEHPAALDHFPSGSMLLPVKPSARPHAENR